ncbi:MAG: type II secretion system protein GspH [Variovorax sp.]|nr:MAG: type II secretion system protein GspH [Variovorax sp.]
MPTSAAGNSAGTGSDSRTAMARRSPQAGFTLLELIVVIAIMALATAGVGFAMRDAGDTALAREADRLVALLESARVQSRTSGSTVYWRATPRGPGDFAFDGLRPGALPTAWLSSEGVGAVTGDGQGRPTPGLQLGPEPIIGAQQVVLTYPGTPERRLRIATDGLRPFAVVATGP